MKSTRVQALLLGRANLVESLLRVVVPIILVRLLDVHEYGYYVLFWLIATTVALIAPFGMARSLLYFIPRSTRSEKEALVSQTIYWMAFMAFLSALAVSQWNPFLPDNIRSLSSSGILIPCFIFLWVLSSLIEFLPNADQDVPWQARAILILALIRNVTIIAAAILSHSVEVIFTALLIFALLKMSVLLYYVAIRYGIGALIPKVSMLSTQLNYAVPFGLSGVFFNLRARIGQWVVAAVFPPGSFAIFSIAISINMIANVLRNTMASVIVPRMSQCESGGDWDGMVKLNNKANVAVSAILFPFAIFVFVFAGLVVEALYTDSYLGAVPVVRIYMAGTFMLAVEMSSILVVLKQGKFVLALSAILLAIASLVTYFGATLAGMNGVAIASVVVMFVGNILNFRRVSMCTGRPLRELQDWGTLAKLLIASATAGIVALAAWKMFALSWPLLFQLAVSGAVFVIAYLGMLFSIGGGFVISTMFGKPTQPA